MSSLRYVAPGAAVAIDDFGTGTPRCRTSRDCRATSSRSIGLRECDVARAQVDGVGAGHDPVLAHDLGLQAVAEGVENTEQEATLRALGCEAAQGFHYSRPSPWTNCWFGCSNARSAALQVALSNRLAGIRLTTLTA